MKRTLIRKILAPVGLVALSAVLRAGDTAIVDGQNAEDVVGQVDGGGAGVFTQGTPYNSVALQGFDMPYGVDIDTVSHRLFVADRYSSRVMEYDLDSGNVLVDRTADHVLGQTNFYGKTSATAKNRLGYPDGVYFDAGSNRLFVADALNARTMIFDVASISDGENAVNELGQANFTAATLATTVNGSNYVYDALFDAPTDRLFVSDYGNNRVLVYDLASITDGENAVNVLGQSVFTTGSTALTQSGFSSPQELAFDSASNRLFVADLNNRRVMVFDVAAITDGENAVNVLGQTTFTTNGTAVTQNGLTAPSGLSYDVGTGRLFVSDISANRIVVYDAASITDGENAVNVLGQTSFTTSNAAVSQSGLLNPRGLAFDPGGNRLYNVDYLHCRVLSFDVASITNGENADNVVGQTDGAGGAVYTTQGVYDGAAVAGYDWAYAVEIDTVAHRMFVADYNTNRVLEYDLDTSNTLVDRAIDHFLGQLEITRNLPTTTAYSTYGPVSMAFDPATNRLFVSNNSSSRVTVFDVTSITDGENAVNVLGQSSWNSATRTASQSGMNLPAGLSFEAANGRLYVGDNVNNRVLIYDVASITDGENAINVLGQSNFTAATSGTTQNTMNSPFYVNHDGGTRLFVGDRGNHRVLVFDTTSITDGENAVNVLGQTNFTTATSGTTQAKFYSLNGLASDRTGNRLFVSDFYNHRLLVFDTTAITDGENAVNVLGQSNFTTGTYATAQNRLYYPQGVTYEPGMNRLYLADRYNSRVVTYSAGPVAPSTSTLAASAGVEQVTLSWNSAGDDGVFNNLTGNYRIQYATYTVSWSTSSTPANAMTVTVATAAMTPGSAQSKIIGSLDGGVTYYFVLWTQDESNNWSGISNTTSAVPSAYAWFDTAQIEVDSVNGGLQNGSVVWGDFDNDGDSDILANGSDASYQLRVYKNNGNGTFNSVQSEVDGANGGIQSGGAVAGDFDNDGDLDVLVVGANSSTSQLRVYRGNGNATFDGAQIEVDGLNGGLTSSSVAWGDYDNDGDLDILTAGSGGGYQLRVYRNNGNGTFDPNQLDVDGVGYGVYQCGTAWGDYDNDGDLDILAGGYDVSGYQLRVYKNNGNGTLNSTQIDVDGSGGGLQQCGVAWGDFDNDGDLDILAVGDNGSKQLRVYKNNGNGTIDAAQIEVDGVGGGLTSAGAAWGDFDNDGDLDILAVGTDGTNRQLRVYRNNGNISFSPNQIEVDGLNGGLSTGGCAWGDFDLDGDLDILTSGTDGTNRQLRVYKNLSAVANSAPSAPTTLTAAWAYNASGISTATFKWNPAVDNGSSATPANVLTYQVEISSSSGFTGKSVVADPHGSSPGMGNYLKPPLIFDGLTTHGVMLYSLPLTNTTFYYRVKTIDAGLKESAWSSTGSLYTPVPSSAPSAVADLSAGQFGDGQITLKWTEPLNINSAGNAQYDVRYSTTAAIANDTDFTNATSLSGEPTPGIPGNAMSMSLLNLTPMVTYYFGLKSSNDNGTSVLDVITPRPNAVASPFDATQIEVDGLRGGLYQGGAAWGDFDNDGDLDVLASGYDGSARQLRVYKNNGNGTIDPAQIEVEALNGGFNASMVAWGDFDNDGDLDILVDGDDSTGKQLRIYKNNANGTFNATQIEVESLNGGLIDGGVAWGDFDNDGDLDVSLNGYDGSNSQLRVYKNNGNGTVDPTQIEVDGLNGGLRIGTVAWGDFDKDGDLDILTNGSTGSNQLRVYKNQGDGTFDTTQIEVDGLNGGIQAGGSTWGDFDNDGDMDILIAGWDGSNSQLRIYKNKNDGTFDTTQIEVDGANNGLRYSSVAWGDHDNDGDLDILISGYDGSNNQLRIYRNNANGTVDPAQIEVDGLAGGLRNCSAVWGDYDNDRDLDILVLGYDGYHQLRIYKNQFEAFQTNTLPTAPSSFSSGFSFTSSSVSVASVSWSAGSDSGTGATPENVLTYDVQISTTSNFGTLMFPGQMGATPRMGSYLKPPKIFNSNTYYGVVLKSTDPWNAQTTASYGLRTDTTYYYRVKTVDAGLAESGWSSNGSAYTGVVPSTSTLAAASTATDGEVLLTWTSAGDDGMNGNVTGTYRIQYATYTPTWSNSSTPTDATTMSIATTTQTPGSAQSKLITGLTGGLTYYFVLWTGDEVPNWSTISNSTSAVPMSAVDVVSPSTSTLSAASGNPEEVVLTWTSAGDDGSTGNLTGNYRIQYATYSATWAIGSTPTNATTVTIATTTQTPGSAQSKTISGLLSGTTYYFAIYTQDESSNWSGVSNTTSALGGFWFDPSQIEVDGAGGGLMGGGVSWGDFDNDGDLDILASGFPGPELRIYKNNGNGTINTAQIEVDGAGGGLYYGGLSWGDFDNDGDLDILISGTKGSTCELRVYKNNGNGTMDATQIDVDGAGGGGNYSSVGWGDYDNDGDLDILASGQTLGATRELRVYKSSSSLNTSNTAPSAPSTLIGSWAHNSSGISTATLKWNAGVDNGTGATSESVLTYQVEVSTDTGFTGKSIVAGQWASPGMGNYHKPPKIFDGSTNYGVMLRSLPLTNTTYYYRVKTIDAGLKESAWSATGSVYTVVASSEPSAVTNLVAGAGEGQVALTWTAPLNIQSGANAYYDVRFSTVSAITDDTAFNNATQATGEPTPGAVGSDERFWITGLTAGVTHYFGIKSVNDNGESVLDVSSPRPSFVANYFDMTQIEVDGAGGGLYNSGVGWGDFDNDGDLDILAVGSNGNYQLRVYRNNGNGTMDPNQIEVDGLNNGLYRGSAGWGDFDNDGDLDILAIGSNGNYQLRVYRNNGNGTMDATQIEVGGLNNGIYQGTAAWGDFENDGDLDILAMGNNGNYQLRVYRNNGNGTMDPTQIEVDGLNNGLSSGSAAWGDFDTDGDLDILELGFTGGALQLRVYKNNGNGTVDPTQIEVDGLNNGLYQGSAAWGDFDNDGDLDILGMGNATGDIPQLRVYKNNGNGTLDPAQVEVDDLNKGLILGTAAWGDFDVDGDIDILAIGSDGGQYQLRVYKNSSATPNTVPTAPTTLTGGFKFNTGGTVSVASFTWNAGTDSGTGATAENGLTYDIQFSTVSNFASVIFPGQMGATPRMGSYLKPPKIFNSNTYYGVMLKSTDPWNTQNTASYGLRTDTTYYYRVKTVDAGLAESGWSSNGSAYTGVSPSTSTLAASATATNGEVLLTWNSAGDDGPFNSLTGTYRIQYATYTPTWSTSSTPTNATTVTIATTTQTAGSAQSKLISGLTGLTTYYFVLWTGDENLNWSSISNTTSAYVASDFVWFDPTQIEVDGAGNGLRESGVAWGDYDNDGDLDILANGYTGSSRELRVYKNNGNGTVDSIQIDVDGAGGGLAQGNVGWGDFDNDGDLDILAIGQQTSGSTQELRVYKNNGNGTINATQIEVDGVNGGLRDAYAVWGDYDNDGDLDILTSGSTSGIAYELRIYKNNSNGTFDAAQIDVDGMAGGLYQVSLGWGDFDNDGDLDILALGYNSAPELRVYKNNGNGTIDAIQINVDGSSNGLYAGGACWGDFDSDGDLDILAEGYDGNNQLRVYRNNGNGTMDATQLEVDGLSNGLSNGATAWGDFDNDGDLDILASGAKASARELRVYKNNGNGTMDAAQIEVDGANGGLYYSGAAWGDYDNDGDLDILASGEAVGTTKELRVYKNLSSTANTAPTAPGTLTGTWNFNLSGISTATFKWAPGVDSGATPTPVNGLTYQLEVSTDSSFTTKSMVAGQWATQGMGNYLKPPLIYDGNTNHGVYLRYLPLNTTYYFHVKTIDAGLKESAWSATQSLYTVAASSVPGVVVDLVATGAGVDGQVVLTWTEPLNVDIGNAYFDVRYSTTGPITDNTGFTNATTVSGEPSVTAPGHSQVMSLIGLDPTVAHYFAIKTTNDYGTSALDAISPRPSATPNAFNATQIEVDGAGNGLKEGGVAWGDFDNDGDVDILASGYTSGGTRELRIYKNNGNGTVDAAQIEVDGSNGGLRTGGVAWGDFDNDGDLDILANGQQTSGTSRELRVYKNNGNGTINATQIEVDGAGNGLQEGDVAWGDFDNDGDLDILASGYTSGSTRELRIYKNNGNGTVDAAQIEVDGSNGGLRTGGVAWGDFDNDGDLDVLAIGQQTTGTTRELRIYKNNGNGTIDAAQIEVDGAGNGLGDGDTAWGDFDTDGDLDILACGYSAGGTRDLKIYKNNGNGTINATQIEVGGVGGGFNYGSVGWGDYENDGDLDILASGAGASGVELRLFKNNGNGTMNAAQIEVDGVKGGVYAGSVGCGDYDNDSDLDILASGIATMATCELRVYKNVVWTANTVPTAPTTLTGGFTFNSTHVSVASLTWNAGTDSGTGATAENGLTYDIQFSTVSNFASVIFPGQMGATPRMGSYLKPPKIFNSNTYYGVVLKSTDPWNAQTTASYGLRTDTTYYYRVKTVDSSLAESAWSSSTGTLNTGVSPSTSTLAATAGTSQVSLSWNSAGDDGSLGNLTGQYRIQYATYTATWSTSSTPTGATTVTIATTTQSPGSAQGYTATSLTGGLTYYFVLWSGDEVPNWSNVSNTTNTIPAGPVTVTLAEAVGQPGWIGQGETQRILGTAQVVSDSVSGVTVSSVAVRETGSYTADGNLTNVEVWVSSSGSIDASAIRLENTAKAFSSDAAVFTQNVTVSTTPLYFIARADVSGSATEGTFDLSLQVYTTALTANNPIAFTNATDVVAPPSGAPSGLTATASGNLLRVSLSWGASAGADTYSVYRATYSGVTTTDFLLGITNATSFNDDYIPPQQQMYYTVLATNRAGASGAGSAANATSVDVSALTTSNIYLRAGVPGTFGNGNPSYRETANTPKGVFCDYEGNVYIADTVNNLIRFIAKKSGTYFGQAMTANSLYTIVGGGGALGDGGLSTSAQINRPTGGAVDINGNLYVADTDNCRVRFVPKVSGTYFGQAMTANYIYTIAGNGTASFSGDGGIGTSAQLFSPTSLAVDVYGNVYIADYGNHRVRFIARATGTYFGQAMTANFIYTIAGDGTGTYGGDGGASTAAQIKNAFGVSVDAAGNVYISDYGNYRIRFVPKTGGTYFGQSMTANYIYTIAGTGTYGYDGDGASATSKRIAIPYGIAVDAGGNLYIADRYNFRVRFVPKMSGTYFGQSMTANYIYTIAGTGTAGYDGDGAVATSLRLNNPYGVGVDNQGNLYVADTTNNRVRFVPRAGGTYFGQSMTASSVYTLVGGGAGGYDRDDSISTSALLNYPAGVTVDADGNIYFSDKNNNRIRFVPKTSGSHFGQSMTANYVYTIAGNGTGGYLADNVAATTTRINAPNGVSVDEDKNVYIADSSNRRIRFIPRTGGTYFGQSMTANYIYTIAGDGTSGYNSDAIAATAAQISDATGVSVDKSGNVYISDYGNHRLRFVPKTGGSYFGQTMTANNIYTIAGNGTGAYGGDGGLATSAQIRNPYGSAVDAEGNVYVADTTNQRIRFIPKTSGTYFGQAMTANFIYTIAGNGTGAFGGDGGAATSAQIWNPTNVSVDGGGNIYIAGNSSPRIRFVPKKNGTYFGQSRTANYIYTIGGNGGTTYDGENGSAAGKNINKPEGVFIGSDHMLYLTDYNNKIRMIAGEDFIAPSTSTLAVAAGLEEATISWVSAGDDNVNLGNLTGNYRIQYATYTAAWSTATTPSNATTVTLATTSVAPGSIQSYTATGLTGGLTYYFVLWSQDEIPNWSDISNTTSTIPVIPVRSVTITSGSSQAFGVVMMGSQVVGTTGTVVTNDGNLVNTYALRASTLTVGSPWQIQSSTPAGPNRMVFYGVFDGGSAPGLGSFDVDDVIGPVNRDSTSAQFSVAGSTTGASVPAGQDRTLWIRLDAPTTTSTVADQTMRIEITAQPP